MLAAAGGQAREPEMDRLSNILAEFNRMWGGKFTEPERVNEVINRDAWPSPRGRGLPERQDELRPAERSDRNTTLP